MWGGRARDGRRAQYFADEHEHDLLHHAKKRRLTAGYASAIGNIAASIISFAGKTLSSHRGRVPGATNVKRQRLDIETMCHKMSDKQFRRRYRMDKDSFWNLLHIIEEHLPSTGEKRTNGGAVPNGPITHSARLSMALRIAAGGDPLDIAYMHGVNDDDPMDSFWDVVDAIHKCSQLDIKFPTSHEEQERLANEFKSKSTVGTSTQNPHPRPHHQDVAGWNHCHSSPSC